MTPYLNPSERCNPHDARDSRRLHLPPPGARAAAHGVADAPPGHAARAGRRRAGVAALSAGLGAAPANAAIPRRDVGGPHAGIQRRPRLLVPRLGHDVLRPAPHDLRVLRSRPRARRRAARPGRHLPGRPVRRLPRQGGHRPVDRPPPRAGGPGPVGAAASRDRGAQSAHHRRRHLARARLFGRAVRRRMGAVARGAPGGVPRPYRARRAPAARVPGDPRARNAARVPPPHGGRVGGDRHGVLEPRDHSRTYHDGRRRLVDAPARQRPRLRHLVPHRRGRAAARPRPVRFGRRGDRARRRAALRLRHHGAGPEHRHATHGLRAAPG